MAVGYAAPLGKFIAFTAAGLPLAGGKVWTYQTGTSTPTTTWSDQPLTVPNTNPVILDSAGRADIWIADASVMIYKFVVQDSNGVEMYTQNGISVPAAATTTAPSAVPAGALLPYAGASAPPDLEPDGRKKYLLCDGQAYNTGTYATLFAVTGYTFGGSTSTFNVPDMRGRFPFGVVVSGSGSARGAFAGAIDHQHDMPQHLHTIPQHDHVMSHTHKTTHMWTVVETGTFTPGPGAGSGPGDQELSPPLGTLLCTKSGAQYADTVKGDQVTYGQDNTNTQMKTGLQTDPCTAGLKTTPNNPPLLAVNFIIKT